jgi:hypothetical protein
MFPMITMWLQTKNPKLLASGSVPKQNGGCGQVGNWKMVKYRSGRWRSSRVFQIYGGNLDTKVKLL